MKPFFNFTSFLKAGQTATELPRNEKKTKNRQKNSYYCQYILFSTQFTLNSSQTRKGSVPTGQGRFEAYGGRSAAYGDSLLPKKRVLLGLGEPRFGFAPGSLLNTTKGLEETKENASLNKVSPARIAKLSQRGGRGVGNGSFFSSVFSSEHLFQLRFSQQAYGRTEAAPPARPGEVRNMKSTVPTSMNKDVLSNQDIIKARGTSQGREKSIVVSPITSFFPYRQSFLCYWLLPFVGFVSTLMQLNDNGKTLPLDAQQPGVCLNQNKNNKPEGLLLATGSNKSVSDRGKSNESDLLTPLTPTLLFDDYLLLTKITRRSDFDLVPFTKGRDLNNVCLRPEISTFLYNETKSREDVPAGFNSSEGLTTYRPFGGKKTAKSVLPVGRFSSRSDLTFLKNQNKSLKSCLLYSFCLDNFLSKLDNSTKPSVYFSDNSVVRNEAAFSTKPYRPTTVLPQQKSLKTTHFAVRFAKKPNLDTTSAKTTLSRVSLTDARSRYNATPSQAAFYSTSDKIRRIRLLLGQNVPIVSSFSKTLVGLDATSTNRSNSLSNIMKNRFAEIPVFAFTSSYTSPRLTGSVKATYRKTTSLWQHHLLASPTQLSSTSEQSVVSSTNGLVTSPLPSQPTRSFTLASVLLDKYMASVCNLKEESHGLTDLQGQREKSKDKFIQSTFPFVPLDSLFHPFYTIPLTSNNEDIQFKESDVSRFGTEEVLASMDFVVAPKVSTILNEKNENQLRGSSRVRVPPSGELELTTSTQTLGTLRGTRILIESRSDSDKESEAKRGLFLNKKVLYNSIWKSLKKDLNSLKEENRFGGSNEDKTGKKISPEEINFLGEEISFSNKKKQKCMFSLTHPIFISLSTPIFNDSVGDLKSDRTAGPAPTGGTTKEMDHFTHFFNTEKTISFKRFSLPEGTLLAPKGTAPPHRGLFVTPQSNQAFSSEINNEKIRKSHSTSTEKEFLAKAAPFFQLSDFYKTLTLRFWGLKTYPFFIKDLTLLNTSGMSSKRFSIDSGEKRKIEKRRGTAPPFGTPVGDSLREATPVVALVKPDGSTRESLSKKSTSGLVGTYRGQSHHHRHKIEKLLRAYFSIKVKPVGTSQRGRVAFKLEPLNILNTQGKFDEVKLAKKSLKRLCLKKEPDSRLNRLLQNKLKEKILSSSPSRFATRTRIHLDGSRQRKDEPRSMDRLGLFYSKKWSKKTNKKKNIFSPRLLIKNRLFIFSVKAPASNIEREEDDLSLLKKRKSFQKKRRITKLKRETRRRKKRLRFYPRPFWLRYRFYSQFIEERFAPRTITIMDSPVIQYRKPGFSSQIGSDEKINESYSKRSFSERQFVLTKNDSIFSQVGSSAVYSNPILLPSQPSSNQISSSVIKELKNVFWKSYWYRKNLDPYLDKMKSGLNEMKKSESQWELVQTIQFCISSFFSYQGWQIDKQLGYSNPVANYAVQLQRKPDIYEEAVDHKNDSLNNNRVGTAPLFGNEEEVTIHRIKNTLSPLFGLSQTAYYLSEYNQVLSNRIQQYVKQIRENYTLNGVVKNRSSHISKRKINERKNKTNLRGGYSIEKLSKSDVFTKTNIYFSSLRHNPLSKLRLNWSYSKIHSPSVSSLVYNKRLHIWTEAEKNRQQTRENKTKNLLKQLKKKISLLRENTEFQIDLADSKFGKVLDLQEGTFNQNKAAVLQPELGRAVYPNIGNRFILSKAMNKIRLKQEKMNEILTNEKNLGLNRKGMSEGLYYKRNGEDSRKESRFIEKGINESRYPYTDGPAQQRSLSLEKITGKTAYWWSSPEEQPFSQSKSLQMTALKASSVDSPIRKDWIWQQRQTRFSNSSLSSTNTEEAITKNISICSLLFHFCSIVTLISISQIRGLFKFVFIGFSKIFSPLRGQLFFVENGFNLLFNKDNLPLEYKKNDRFGLRIQLEEKSTQPLSFSGKRVKGSINVIRRREKEERIRKSLNTSKGQGDFIWRKTSNSAYFSKKNEEFLYAIRDICVFSTGGNGQAPNGGSASRFATRQVPKDGSREATRVVERRESTLSTIANTSTWIRFLYFLIRSAMKKPIIIYKKISRGTNIKQFKVPQGIEEAKRKDNLFLNSFTNKKEEENKFYMFSSIPFFYSLILLTSLVKRRGYMDTENQKGELFRNNKKENVSSLVKEEKRPTLSREEKSGSNRPQKRLKSLIDGTIHSFYTFFSKPGELIIDWVAYAFLVEWASDIPNTLPISFETKVLSLPLEKMTRSIYGINLFISIGEFLEKTNATRSAIYSFTKGQPDLSNSFSSFNPSSFYFLNLTSSFFKRRIYHLYEIFLYQFYQPDTDLLVRHQKGSVFWDIWGDFLIKTAEESNLNIPSLTNLKEEQMILLDKVLETYNEKEGAGEELRKVGKGQKESPRDTNQVESLSESRRSNVTDSLSEKKQISGSMSRPQESNRLTLGRWPLRGVRKKSLVCRYDFINSFSTWGSQPFLSYSSGKKDTSLFIDLHPPRSLRSARIANILNSLKSNRTGRRENGAIDNGGGRSGGPNATFIQPLPQEERAGSLICQVFAGIMTKQIEKNILVIGSAGMEKTLLVQAIAGETELKIITENAKRYAFVYRGVAVGIKLLRDVFDSLSLQTPCLFLIEDIHAIGERRPLLISDEENTMSGGGRESNMERNEKNRVLYQYSKHVITHYKKPYKGDFSLLIPSNLFSFSFFSGPSGYRQFVEKEKSSTQRLLGSTMRKSTLSSPIPLYSENSNTETTQHNDKEETKTKENQRNKSLPILASRLSLPNSTVLAPPATSPFSVLTIKEEKKKEKNEIEREIPWGQSLSRSMTTGSVRSASSPTYSIRVKVALLADMALSSLSIKLDIITDLLVIIDSVKGNKGFVVFATTHIPFILDPALRRPGRLDETIRLGGFRENEEVLVRTRRTGPAHPRPALWEMVKSTFSILYTVPSFKALKKKGGHQSIGSSLDFNLTSGRGVNLTEEGGKVLSPAVLREFAITSRRNRENNFSLVTIKPSLNNKDLNRSEGSLSRLYTTNRKGTSVGRESPKSIKINILAKAYFNASYTLYTLLRNEKLSKQIDVKELNKGSFVFHSPLSSFDKTNISSFSSPSGSLRTLYSSPQTLKTNLSLLIAVRFAGEFLFLKKTKTLTPFLSTDASMTSLSSTLSTSQAWQTLSSLVLSYIQKRIIYNQHGGLSSNGLVTKLLDFNNKETLHSPASPPFSSILLPTKRFFNYKRSFFYLANKASASPGGVNSLMEKIQKNQQQRLVKKLYSVPVKESFKSSLSSISSLGLSNTHPFEGQISSEGKRTRGEQLGFIGSINPSFLQKSNSLFWFVRNRVLMRHKTDLTNQWWNGQLPSHNPETTFLSDIDWRYNFISNYGDILLDFPDAEQYYNPRQRRWVLTDCQNNNNTPNRIKYGKKENELKNNEFVVSSIYSHFIYSSLFSALSMYSQNREVLDYYAFYLQEKSDKVTGGAVGATPELSRLKLLSRFCPLDSL